MKKVDEERVYALTDKQVAEVVRFINDYIIALKDAKSVDAIMILKRVKEYIITGMFPKI